MSNSQKAEDELPHKMESSLLDIENPDFKGGKPNPIINDKNKSNIIVSKVNLNTNTQNLNENQNNYNIIEDLDSENLAYKVLLDKIMDQYGYRFQIIKVIVGSILLSYLSSYMIYHVSCFLLVVKKEFNLADDMLTILACVGFFFKALGCMLTGPTTNIVSRRSLLLFNVLILIALNFMLTFVWKLWAYFIFLIIGCYIAGNIDPLNLDVLCESLPIKFRGFFLCLSYTGFPLNICIQYFLISSFSQQNETDIITLLHINSLIIIVIFILMIIFFKDSIRHELIRENYDSAYKLLNNMSESPLTQEEKEIIKYQSIKGNNSISEASIKEIFSPYYLSTTLLFICLNFSFNSMTDGISFVLNLILSDNIPKSNEEIISWEGMKLYLWGLLAYAFCGILTEIPFIKRKLGLFITSAMILSFSILFYFNPYNYFWWLNFLLIACNASTSLSISFVSESYPTKIRDTSQGFMNSVANFGSLVGQLIFMSLYNISKTNTTLIYTLVISFVCMFLIFLVKKETHRKPLDHYEGVEGIDENDVEEVEKIIEKERI